jgi:type VI secretion system secreted protein VgrG
LATGRLFELDGHTRTDQNQKYLITQVQLSAADTGGESGGEAGSVKCSLTAQPASQQFRPPRTTPKPFVQGPQTAVVTGPAGEEIYTDKYGRVKVHFHWDRAGDTKDKSSCFVRVSSPWAGKSFGFVQIPRIGQEVVVDFLEGDPDQPLITGRVYNADNMPPWELPANATQSGVLTRSSKGGAYGNANALRFEDKKGAEELWLHAEKDQRIEVENDETHWVGHDRTKTVDNDEKHKPRGGRIQAH